ncbi:MAG: hypothetical protein KIT11_11905 [Fimbriimonadaceae bacterium]|nr:hypothetical protein [Fimbriimonadaceae bacterium]QYK55261.1 MAG: hypothetical protein KF733_09630 [Fimbriimonadaceae bacterium]
MNIGTYTLIKLTLGVIATIGLYSVLYKETKLYRFFEHIFLGLAAGYSLVALWRETLFPLWWEKMVGQIDTSTGALEQPAYWIYAILLPVGLMGYWVFSKKNGWMSRVPIGIILGLWAGQQIQVWWQTYSGQIMGSMQPIIPTSIQLDQPFQWTKPGTAGLEPAARAAINGALWPSQALSNLIFVVTVLASLSYFLFSFELKGKFLLSFNKLGRWMLMVGFGAIFGSTVMARFALVIDRMFFIWVEWIQSFQNLGGGGPAG